MKASIRFVLSVLLTLTGNFANAADAGMADPLLVKVAVNQFEYRGGEGGGIRERDRTCK